MNFRAFRHSVSIYEAVNTASLDDRGQPNGAPTIIASSVPCRIVETRSGEREISNQASGVGSHVVTMHRDSQVTVTSTCHLTWEGRTLNVIGVTADERNAVLTISCQEAKA